ncbi:MAG: prepilin peptidase [Pseudolactococcus laudensis]
MTIFLIFTLGTILGSFFGLIIDRLPEHSIVSPRSHCENYGQILIWQDLIPVISQLINCASCRYCKIKLTYWYSILELSCGTLFVMVWLERVDLTFSLICLASFLMVILILDRLPPCFEI